MATDEKTPSEPPVKGKAAKIIDDLEDAGEAILKELSEQYGKVRAKVTDYAHTVADTTVAVTEKVTSQETRDRLSKLVEDVETTGEQLLHQANERIKELRDRVTSSVAALRTATPQKEQASKRKAAKKKVVKKKTANKKASKKKAVKKTAAKKKATKKKAVKKKAAKKKVAKKKAVKKKTAKKKTARRG